jgi:ribonuclease Z
MVFNVTPRDIRSACGNARSRVAEQERHQAFRAARRKQRLQMSRWLADKQLFPKF